ncbi:MAG: hypothetical protein RBS25_05220 [Bacilli bacterium]|nr:hypothetical protein [Bacilli bacterium]
MFKNEKIKKAFSVTVNVLLSVLIVIILLFTIYAFSSTKNGGIPKFFNKSYLTVLSNSMNARNETYDSDGFKRGDIIVIDRVTWMEAADLVLNEGDIVTFEWVDDDGNFIYNTHRIIETNTDAGGKYCITQGDLAAFEERSTDPDDGYAEKVYYVKIVGVYQSTIKGLGNVVLFFQSPTGFLLFIVLPLVGLFVYEGFRFAKVFKEYKLEKQGGNAEPSKEDLAKQIEELKAKLAQKDEPTE